MKSIFAFVLFLMLGREQLQSQVSTGNIQLQALCKTLGNEKTIIGLGESTHGTKEFTLIRAEMVKLLITQYNFKLFILEAEFAPCENINTYLNSGKGNADSLLRSIRVWPWINEDFLSLLVWIKDYNVNNPTQKVRFYGMDSQYSKVFAKKDTILKYYPEQGKKLFEIVEGEQTSKRKLHELRNLSNQVKTSTSDLQLQYYIFCQINKLATAKLNDQYLRDENMARFVQLIQAQHGDSVKSIIWAHNGHIRKQGSQIRERKASGQYLAEFYGNNYAAIGLDFKEGTFLAVDFEQAPYNKFRSFTLNPIKKTLAEKIDFGNETIIVVKGDDLNKSVYINAIGAIYLENPVKVRPFYSKVKRNKQFDYLIISKISTPIALLPNLYE